MHETRKELKKTYDKISSHFDSTRKRPWPIIACFIDTQKKGSLILDLAAGTGRHALYAKSIGKNPIASDFSTGQLIELKKKERKIPTVLHDLEHIPFKDNTFDAITYIAAIHHLETETARINSLKESKRILKPAGKIITTAWVKDQPRFRDKADKNGDIHYTWDKKYPRFYHLFEDEELERLHEKAGLEIQSSTREGENYYVFAGKTLKSTGAKKT